jgi:hypothetical protein
MRLSSRLLTLGALATAAAALACSENPNAMRAPSLSAAQADSVAAAVVADLDGMPEGAVFDVLALPSGPQSPTGTQACEPTISPFPPVNSDDDPIPDSVRVDFTGCVIEFPHETVTLFGAKDIVDLVPLVAGHHVRARFLDLGRSVTRTGTGATWSVTHNGVRQFSASATELDAQEIDFLSEFVFPDGATALHERDWSSTFTADAGLEITPRHLPAGTWIVNGTSAWTKGERSWSLAVTNLAPLHYDPACEFRPRFDAGGVQVVATRGDQTSTVTIEFTACGQYTVTRS